ncbi:MAG TPA: D-aminoacyl-tRNA deacylase [Candidatus Hydrogenedentes bacterium]|nr:D-aminoacyl-tRNA deacylase [Candidatus Hydrogenedentota bacterium]HPG69426.1 D-aminoacyl-tRNA deacylase [Candidatus Hydrogenedentota bacterium]
MRAVVQRVNEASVEVGGRIVGAIERGLLVLVSVAQDDQEKDVAQLAEKVAGLRCFEDEDSKFNLSVRDVGGGILVVSQFTLHGDCRKGRRPSFSQAAPPEIAVPLYEAFVARLRQDGFMVATGEFGASMEVRLVNHGPVTLLIDTKKTF